MGVCGLLSLTVQPRGRCTMNKTTWSMSLSWWVHPSAFTHTGVFDIQTLCSIAFYFLDWLAVIAKRKVTCPYNLTPAIGLKFCLSFLIEDKWRWYWAGMWGRWYRSLDLNVSSWLVSPTIMKSPCGLRNLRYLWELFPSISIAGCPWQGLTP